jgi:hypothetical protein
MNLVIFGSMGKRLPPALRVLPENVRDENWTVF